MQVVLALPGSDEIGANQSLKQTLERKIDGIPLLVRVILTAVRSGGTQVLLLLPKGLLDARLKTRLQSPLLSNTPIDTVVLDRPFDREDPAHWAAIDDRLQAQFLWLPWNLVLDRRLMVRLIAAGKETGKDVRLGEAISSERPAVALHTPNGEATPVVVTKEALRAAAASGTRGAVERGLFVRYLANVSLDVISGPGFPGVIVHSPAAAKEAERYLVRRSGKDSDGIHSGFNRRLCWPAVRWLSKTRVTPNLVTFAGLLVAVASAYFYAQGHWTAYVAGALLFYVSVLFDEMDGMLARISFRESAFGCWLETFADYASYVLLFSGMTVGLYRQSGRLWLLLGGLLLFGTVTSFLVASYQRKLATDPSRPHEYLLRFQRRLDADSGNPISRAVRRVECFMRKAILAHYVVIFTVLGGLKVLFFLAVLGANLVWSLGLYFNRLFRPSAMRPSVGVQEACQL